MIFGASLLLEKLIGLIGLNEIHEIIGLKSRTKTDQKKENMIVVCDPSKCRCN